jgi:hypothetical protein
MVSLPQNSLFYRCGFATLSLIASKEKQKEMNAREFVILRRRVWESCGLLRRVAPGRRLPTFQRCLRPPS